MLTGEKRDIDSISEDKPTDASMNDNIFTIWFEKNQDGFDAKGQGDDSVSSLALVKLCVQSMRQKNPTRNVVLITDENVNEWIDPFDLWDSNFASASDVIENWAKGGSTLAQISDVLRVVLVSKYGGDYLDASCLALRGFSSFVTNREKVNAFELRQWRGEGGGKYIEPWFSAAAAKNEFMGKLAEELACNVMDAASYGKKQAEYLGDDMCNFPGKDAEAKEKMMAYLWITVAQLKVLKDMGKSAEDVFVLHDANEGPFLFKPATQREIGMFDDPSRAAFWPDKKMVFMSNVLLDCDSDSRIEAVLEAAKRVPFIKFNNSDRAAILNTIAGIPPAGSGNRNRIINFYHCSSLISAIPSGSAMARMIE